MGEAFFLGKKNYFLLYDAVIAIHNEYCVFFRLRSSRLVTVPRE